MAQPISQGRNSSAAGFDPSTSAIEMPDHTPWQRAYRRWLRLRFRDEVQRAAHLHLYDDLAQLTKRTAAYRAEDALVRRQVIMELERRVELLAPGRAAPAWSSLIQGFVAAVTIFGTLLLAVFNGWFAAVMTMMDKETGVLHGVTQQQISATVSTVQTPIIYAIGILIFIVVATLVGAATKDAQRGAALAWLHLFTNVDREATATTSQEADDAGSIWSRIGRHRKRRVAAAGDHPIGKLR